MTTHYAMDSTTGDWLRELARMHSDGECITLVTETGEPIATVDVMTAQDLVGL